MAGKNIREDSEFREDSTIIIDNKGLEGFQASGQPERIFSTGKDESSIYEGGVLSSEQDGLCKLHSDYPGSREEIQEEGLREIEAKNPNSLCLLCDGYNADCEYYEE
jgi:hypothetical protein